LLPPKTVQLDPAESPLCEEILSRLVGLLAILISFACVDPYQPTQTELVVAHAKTAVVKLSIPGRVCTAFHIGNDIFITAAHCLDGERLLFLEDNMGGSYLAVPVIIDEKTDLATLHSKKHFTGGTLELWGQSDEKPHLGAEIISFGYPGYYGTGFIFEAGLIKGFATQDGVRLIVSNNLGYFGESGGPVVSVQSGKVVGVTDALSEQITRINSTTHLHNTISLIVAAPELLAIVERTQLEKFELEGI